MKIAVYVGKDNLRADCRIAALEKELREAGCDIYTLGGIEDLQGDTDYVMSVGGDGTFLSAAMLVADSGIPVVGVNLGRMGFLSENRPEDVAAALLNDEYVIEDRALLRAEVVTGNPVIDNYPYALNEMTVRRSGAAMLGVDVTLDGVLLPTYWADGLVISTSSGSTAYSLSVGGPIVLPESKVLIISPIAPHNLNVRPLVVPDSSEVSLKMHSRDGRFEFSIDNRTVEVGEDTEVSVRMAQFSLKRVRLGKSNFINALTDKLFWGEDVRNIR
jgi:NAD+ kinase